MTDQSATIVFGLLIICLLATVTALCWTVRKHSEQLDIYWGVTRTLAMRIKQLESEQ